MFRNVAAIISIFDIALSHAQKSPSCYTNNGSRVERQTPCDPIDDVSTCCDTGDYCLNNKLCQIGPNSTDYGSLRYYTSSCTTDAGYKTPCIDFCNTALGYVEKCSSQTYCCAEGGTDCCSRENGLDAFFQLEEPYITATALISSETDVSVGGGSDGKNRLIIGLGVGVPCGLIIVGTISLFLWRGRAQRRAEPRQHLEVKVQEQEHRAKHRSSEDAAPPYKSYGAADSMSVPHATSALESRNSSAGTGKPTRDIEHECVNIDGFIQERALHAQTLQSMFEAPDNVVAPNNRFELDGVQKGEG